MKNKLYYVTFSFLIMLILPLSAKATKLKGTFADVGEVIYTVTIEPQDSLYKKIIYTGFGENINLEFQNIQGNVTVQIDIQGYTQIHKTFSIQEPQQIIDLGRIILEKSVNLQEVVIKAEKISRNGNNYTIRNIQMSKIGQAGDFFDMLKFTPGVIVRGGNEISVLGKGTPKIYINGREVKNQEELYAYQSTDVSSIEVIRQPDASYDASTSCVIRINTKERYKEYMGLNVSNSTDIKEKISNSTNLNFNINKGIFAGTASLTYAHSKGMNKDYSKTVITHSEKDLFSTAENSASNSKNNKYNLFIGMNFNFKKGGKIGLQYTGNLNNNTINKTEKQTISENDNLNKKNNLSDDEGSINLHNTSLSYVLFPGKDKVLTIIADYAHKNINTDRNLSEKDINSGETIKTIINNDSYYDIYTLTPQYKFKFSKKDNEEIGLKTGYLYTKGDNYINESPQLSIRKNSFFSSYYTYSQTWGKWSVSLGLRYEYDKVSTDMKGENPLTMNKTYSNIFPNGTIKYKISDKVNMSAVYRRQISKPTFSNLSPTIYYNNEYNYSTGNPNLRPTFYDRMELTWNLYGLGLNASYSKITDKSLWVTTPKEENSNILIQQPINIKNSHSWSFSADYYKSMKWLEIYASAELEIPHLKYPYLNTTMTSDRASYDLMLRLTFNIYKSLSYYLNTSYTSKSDNGITTYEARNSIDTGISAKFFKNKLYAAIDASDLLRKSITPEWERFYLNTYKWQKNKYDTRGVKITLRWTFNNIKSKFINRSGNMGELFRAM